jgi:hypothetical protein
MGIRAGSTAKAGMLLRHYTELRAARQISLAVRRIEASNDGTDRFPRELAREFGRTTEPGQTGSSQLFMY